MFAIVSFIIAMFSHINVNAMHQTPEPIIIKTQRTDRAVAKNFAAANNNTLVVFDCDEVLITPIDPILQPKNRTHFHEMFDGHSEIDLSILTRDMNVQLLDPNWPFLIQDLQCRGIKTILLTACLIGEYGCIPSMEERRRNQLLKFNIDFKQSWPDEDRIEFSKFIDELDEDRIPNFSDGMLFSLYADKGAILGAFLKRMNITPNKIIFIDDQQYNLESVLTMCQVSGIEFVGILYTCCNTIDSNLDIEKANRQAEILKKEKRWVSHTDI